MLQYAKARPVLAIIAGVLFAGSAAAQGANPFAFFLAARRRKVDPPTRRPRLTPGRRPYPDIRLCPDFPIPPFMSLDACGTHTLGLSITNSPAPTGARICGRLSIRTTGNLQRKSWQRLKR